jgi:cytochrome c biogenesis protein CcdA
VFGIDVALLLGLRHATDPDHLAAVSTLVASDDGGARRAQRLGLAWGTGHALTLFAFGLPVVLFGDELPGAAQRGAELAIGLIIVALAVRLLLRWRSGLRAGGAPEVRSPLAAFGIGLVHGAGGSAAAGALVVGATGPNAQGAVALAVFALGTALSMAAASTAFGHLLRGRRAPGALGRVVPALGIASIAFGTWYALAALDAVAYPL